jgi:hypothetical protein
MRVNAFEGRWRISKIDPDPGRKKAGSMGFDANGGAILELGDLAAGMDCRFLTASGLPQVEFSWDGSIGGKRASGRGWATITRGRIMGSLFIHFGAEILFEGNRPRSRKSAPARPASARRKRLSVM